MIRLARPSDSRAIAELYGPIVRDTVISFETVAPSEAEMERRIVSTLAYAPWLVCERDDGLRGYVYASKHHERAAYQWSVDVAAYTHENHRRANVARALYRTLLSLLTVQGFYAAHAGIALPNAASVGLHEALGFAPSACIRLWASSTAHGTTSAGGSYVCATGWTIRRRRFLSRRRKRALRGAR